MSQAAEQIEETKQETAVVEEPKKEVVEQPVVETPKPQAPRKQFVKRPQNNVVSINKARPQTTQPKMVYNVNESMPQYYQNYQPLPTLGMYDHRNVFQKLMDHIRTNPYMWGGGALIAGFAVWYLYFRK